MEFKKIFLTFLFTFLIFQFLHAQDYIEKTDSGLYKLSDIVVTATKTETPLLEIANSVSIIDSNEIAQKGKFNVFDLLKSQPGVSVAQQGAPGGLSYVSIRGGNSEHTLVLIDGVEVNMPNDPGNTYDFANLSVDNIKKIEILRGPQSTLYGSDALAGVINILTKKGTGKPELFLSSEGGSYNTYKILAGLNARLGIFTYSLTGSKFKTDGFSSVSEEYGNTEKDGTTNYNFSGNLGLDITKDLNLSFLYRYTKANTDYDQSIGKLGDDPTYIYKLEESVFRTEANFSFFKGMWQQKLGVSYFRNVRKYSYDSILINPSASRSFYDGRKIKFDWQNNFILSKNINFILGLETEEEKASSEYYIYSSTFPFTSILPSNNSRTSGIYLENQFKFANSFFGSIGIRYDNHDRFGSQFTYRIAPAYIFWKTKTKIKATVGTGFKAPSLFYLYDPAFGNINLKPVKSLGWDFGIEQFFINNNLTFGLTYFNNSFEDLFGYDQNFRTININKAETNGFEFFLTIKPVKNLNVKLNYTFTNSKDKSENSEDKGLPLLRRPKNKFAVNINYNFSEDLNSGLEIIYTGKRDDKDFSVFPSKRIELDEYTLVNFSASYNLSEIFKLFGRVENLFDKKYQEVLFYGTPGLSAYAGIKLSF